MKIFHCDNCQNVVFFENLSCAQCGHELAFVPALGAITAIVAADENLWQRALPPDAHAEATPPQYRKCQNYVIGNICNWAVAADDPNPLCVSCRLTQTIPDLDQPGYRDAWFRLESAKRRLVYSLLELRLPISSKLEDPSAGVAFEFLADRPPADGVENHVLTGHDKGIIVINVAEADDAERERRRVQMHEPYRTLLGHLRHEIGHYYWDRLIRDSDRLDAFRAQFGDETQDYGETLQAYYANGAPPDWQQRFVTAYASAHPWEDWAETWAHYLHITDTLETADTCGLSLQPQRDDEPKLALQPVLMNPAEQDFDRMIERWFPLTYLLNNLNRGLGLPDAYPFVLSMPALEKLRFVHETLAPQAQQPVSPSQTQVQSQSTHQARELATTPPVRRAAAS
ncbi:MAG: hypothetical protein JWR16_606 [Nevskia sp.]|nr:hypothetical protein [Nevskia sp.]